MIIDCGVYDSSRSWRNLNGLEMVAEALDRDPSCFGRVSLDDLSGAEQALVERLFGFRGFALEETRRSHQRPKLEMYEDSLVVVLRTLSYIDESSTVETGQSACSSDTGWWSQWGTAARERCRRDVLGSDPRRLRTGLPPFCGQCARRSCTTTRVWS